MARVSIITALYNHEKYIADAIESVVAQTYNDWELLIWDDGSTDKSREIAEKYAVKDPRVKVFTHSKNANLGQENTRNAALDRASGELICLLDSDDLYYSRKLELLVPCFNQSEVGLAYGRHDHLLSDVNRRVSSGVSQQPEGRVFLELAQDCFLGANATMFRRECIASGLRFDSSFRTMGEYPLWLKIARDWKFAFVPELVSTWRDHGSNLGTKLAVQAKQELVVFFERLSTDSDYEEFHSELQKVLAKRYYDLAAVLYSILDLNQARRASWQALSMRQATPLIRAKSVALIAVTILGQAPNRYIAAAKQELWQRRHPLASAVRKARKFSDKS